MKKIFGILIFYVCSFDVSGQKITTSEQINANTPLDAFYFLKELDDRLYFYGDNQRNISMLSVREDLSDPQIEVVETENSSIRSERAIVGKKGIGWIVRRNDFKRRMFVYELTTLSTTGRMSKPQVIVELRYKNEDRLPYLTTSYSPDSSKILLAYEIDFDRKDEYSAYVQVMNSSFEKESEYDYFSDESQRRTDVKDWIVSNNGDVFFVETVYEKDNLDLDKKDKSKKRRNKRSAENTREYIQAYTIKMHKFIGPDLTEAVEIGKEGHFVRSHKLTHATENGATVVKCYGYRDRDPIEGIETEIYNNDLSLRSTETYAFQEAQLERLDKRYTTFNNYGMGLVSDFTLNDIYYHPDNSITCIVDIRGSRTYTRGAYNPGNPMFMGGGGVPQTVYYALMCLSVSINPLGKIDRVTLIPRDYRDLYRPNLNCYAIKENDKSYIFFNDRYDRDSDGDANPKIIEIDKDNYYSKKEIIETSRFDYQYKGAGMYREGKYIIPAIRGGNKVFLTKVEF